MKFDKNVFRLYAVTDGAKTTERELRDAIRGGVTCVQLREKNLSTAEFIQKASIFQAICAEQNVPLIINDRVDVALAAGAAGVHLGLSDGSLSEARRILGPDVILGASVHSVEEAVSASRAGADTLGVGAIFPSSTKPEAESVSLETLREITAAVSIPVVAIGGISGENIGRLRDCGVAGVALVSAIFCALDIVEAARAFDERTRSLGFFYTAK